MLVLSNIWGSSRTWSCCYTSNTSKEKSAKKLYSKKIHDTCTDLSLGGCQDHGLCHGEQQELCHGLHFIWPLPPQLGLGEGDQVKNMCNYKQVTVPYCLMGSSALLPWGRILCCLWKNALLPKKKNAWLSKGSMPCCQEAQINSCLGKEFLGSLGDLHSLAPVRNYSVWLLRRLASWLPRGLLSLALKGLLTLALRKLCLNKYLDNIFYVRDLLIK